MCRHGVPGEVALERAVDPQLGVTGETAERDPGDPGVEFARWRQGWRRGHRVSRRCSPVTPGAVHELCGHRYPGDVILGELGGVGRGGQRGVELDRITERLPVSGDCYE